MKSVMRLSGVMLVGALAVNVALVTEAFADVEATYECKMQWSRHGVLLKEYIATYVIDRAIGWRVYPDRYVLRGGSNMITIDRERSSITGSDDSDLFMGSCSKVD